MKCNKSKKDISTKKTTAPSAGSSKAPLDSCAVLGASRPDVDIEPVSFIKENIKSIKQQVGTDNVFLALSGGLDSSVLAVLLKKSVGNNLKCYHLDTGLMRENESINIVKAFKKHFKLDVVLVDASKQFFKNLKGVIEPEEKRKIIGKTYIDVFEQEAKKIKNCKWLAQGTIWSDVVESGVVDGTIIKSHHNVGGLPEKLNLKLLEPLRELYKSEVRNVGKALNMPEDILTRQPFPGPGLAVRILGEVTPEKVAITQKADAIFTDVLKQHNIYKRIGQSFVVLLPIRSVGITDQNRTYGYTCVLRTVCASDGLKTNWFQLPGVVLDEVSRRITAEVSSINRVVYDITSKPPSTIE